MFKKHPQGLIAAALANMGERFGFYTMMAILVLFLQAKFGLNGTDAGLIYSVFYFSIYILAFIGGLIADKTRNYKGTIFTGIVLMSVGYLVLAIPSPTPVSNMKLYLTISCIGLFIIAFGNGLFKGNLQALVGQMYDDEKYSKMRDSGFSLFYMFINVGAIFAPLVAVGVRNWWLNVHGYAYNADLPALCHGQLAGSLTPEATDTFNRLAGEVSKASVTDYFTFSADYLNVFTTGFHYAFAIAILAMGISLFIYLSNKKRFPDPGKKVAVQSNVDKTGVEMDAREVKQRLYALIALFGVVIFFWFSFHQNGLTLTFFAKEYTNLSLFGKDITVELFQSLNPFFVVCLTPIVMGLFGWQRARGKEPSTPKKIAIGMGLAAVAYTVMTVCSYLNELPLHKEVMALGSSPVKVTPLLLIVTYLILTFAELYISPLGISFVSKVAPPKYQGVMQGGWLGATAVGNQLLFIGSVLYESVPIWMTWAVFVAACSISMITMFCLLGWMERVAK